MSRKRLRTFWRTRRGCNPTTSVVGFSLLSFTRTSYNAFFFVTLKPWDDRKARAEQFQEIKANLNRALSQTSGRNCVQFLAPRHPRRRYFGWIYFRS